MVSRQTLENAAAKKLIHPEQVEALYRYLNESPAAIQSEGEEPLRFVRSFGDIFITLGVVLLVFGINMWGLSGYYHLLPALGFVALAEWLVRVRRLALPGIALLLAILFFVNKAFSFNHEYTTITALSVVCLTSLVFYLRYRMPFSLFPLAAGLVAIVIIQGGADVLQHPIIFSALGLLVFLVAMVFDALDTRRRSQLSDSAFWLHVLAAPLIVHGAMISMLLSDQHWIESISREILIVAFFSGFFLLALLIDRRALLISTQLYVIYALTQLLQDQLSAGQNILMLTLMALGLFVIFFGTYWYWVRRLLFGFLADSAISRFIPDLHKRDGQYKQT